MRDTLIGHHAPGFAVWVGTADTMAVFARAFTLHEAQRYIREAEADGYWRGEVRVGDRVIQTWPDLRDDQDIEHLDDEGGFAPHGRRRRP